MASDSNKANQPTTGNALPRGLVSRSGNLVAPNTRLPSLRGSRDLTLGGVAKLTFKPTISAAHKPKVAVKTETNVRSETPASREQSHRGRGRGEGDRGRGRGSRGRGRGQLTQLSGGLFADGVANAGPKRGYENNVRQSLHTPTTKLEAAKPEFKTKAEEEQYVNERLKRLMCDDFIDDGDMDPYADLPVKLPLIPKDFYAKELCETEGKSELKTEIIPKIEDNSNGQIIGGVKIKSEPTDDVKPPLKTMKVDDTSNKIFPPPHPSLTSSNLLQSLCKLGKEELLLVRVPDDFASLVNIVDKPVIKQEPGTSFASGNREDMKSSLPQNETTKQSKLSELPEGFLGKLQVMKSGKTRLVVGNTILDVELGGPVDYLQDLVSVRTSGEHPSMAVLGHTKHTLICTPKFDKFLISEDTS